MEIRIATKDNKQAVLGLLDEFSEYLGSQDRSSKLGGEIFEEIINRQDIKIFIAEEDEEAVAVATFYLIPNLRHGYHRGHVEDFFVSSKMRRKNVGTKLFNVVKDYCRKNNIRVLKLDSGNELQDAHKFYEKLGGKTTERFFRFDL